MGPTIAVLGCGSIGRRHLRNLRELGFTNLVGFDPSSEARELADLEGPARWCGTIEQVWRQEPNVVFVTTPSNLHLDLALAAVRRDCHLFVEKPLSHTLDGLDALATEVAERGLVSMVACNMRFHPGPSTIKSLLEANAIGDVLSARIHAGSYLPGWRPAVDYRQSYSASSERGGGVILDCIHEIDLALWFFGPGELAGAVNLPARSLGIDVEGISEMLVRHESGVVSSVHLNFVQRDYRRFCQVFGSDGSLYWDFEKASVLRYGADGLAETIDQPADWTVNQMFVDEARHFMTCVARGIPAPNGVAEATGAVRLAVEAKRAGNRSGESDRLGAAASV